MSVKAMSEKFLVNSVESCAEESLLGFSKLRHDLHYYIAQKIVIDSDSCSKKRIAVVSGGGSGHEPFPAGYVGGGMLTASVSGSVFTSPPSKHILHAIRLAAAESAGVLLIIPNYTGDVLNFGLATELAAKEGIQVDSIVVGEDIAQEIRGIFNKAGKRGTCGLVLVLKIAGYLAHVGESAAVVKKMAEMAAKSMASLGLCMTPCAKPGGGLLFRLGPEELELGVGVHGEAGVARFRLAPASEIVKTLLDYLVDYLALSEGAEVAVLVNNLGSLSCMELWLVAGEVHQQLSNKNIKVARLYTGCYFTSLNMSGVQICILKFDEENRKIYLEALDHRTDAFAWSDKIVFNKTVSVPTHSDLFFSSSTKFHSKSFLLSVEQKLLLKKCLENASNALIKAKSYLNQLDSICGDGDCGTTMSRLGQKILSIANEDLTDAVSVFFKMSSAVQESIGGTSGAIYGLFFLGVGQGLEKEETNESEICLAISRCWREGINGIKKYSKARLGDRTMLDPLETACEIFEKTIESKIESFLEAFRRSVNASHASCKNTSSMKALAGRASYIDQSRLKSEDAGAHAVTVWLSAILSVLESSSDEKIEKNEKRHFQVD